MAYFGCLGANDLFSADLEMLTSVALNYSLGTCCATMSVTGGFTGMTLSDFTVVMGILHLTTCFCFVLNPPITYDAIL